MLKKKIIESILFVAFGLFWFTDGYTMGTKSTAMEPLSKRKLLVQDEEFLKYSWYAGSEKYAEDYYVYRINQESNTVSLYFFCDEVKNSVAVPKNYEDFSRKVMVSLDKASLIRYSVDLKNELGMNNQKERSIESLDLDYHTGEAKYIKKFWKNEEMRFQNTRVRINPKYPIWEISSVAFIGTRFLDLKKPGIIMLVQPNIIKEAVPVSFVFKGKEEITTPAGKFHTQHYGFQISDPFMARLLESFTKEIELWIEDSERAFVIKAKYPGRSCEIESIGIWKE